MHLVTLHLLRTVVVVKRCVIHLILTLHLQLVTAQHSENFLLGEPSVDIRVGQSLQVVQDVGVDSGVELPQSVEISEVMNLQYIAFVQPGEEELAAEANDVLKLVKRQR